ncbi:response regulator [Algoriphagus sp.]|uniref:response regulator n=1 Tax=Algoriphagus sp. TaxID=1872435 RepID=UPI00391D1C9B
MKSKKVLIVDDNDLNRKLFENLIGQIYSFESAKNGIEAITMTENEHFDLILMDIQMPQMDGITAMRKIRQRNNAVCPILAVTAYAEETDRDSFINQGFDDFITKPIRPKEFIKLIQVYLNQSRKIENLAHQNELSYHEILDKNIVEQLLKYNSKSVFKMIFDDFLIECNETKIMIEEYYSSNHYLDLIEKIHAIKGNSGTLGAMKIYASAAKAEDFGRKENYVQFEEELKILENEILKFQDFLKQETIFDP